MNEFFHALRAFFEQRFGSVRVTQPIAGTKRILQMKMDFVFVASAAAFPPSASCVVESVTSRLARTATLPAAANSMAARSPATPAPITRKSVSAGAHFINKNVITLDSWLPEVTLLS
jgi:hypothetical protein